MTLKQAHLPNSDKHAGIPSPRCRPRLGDPRSRPGRAPTGQGAPFRARRAPPGTGTGSSSTRSSASPSAPWRASCPAGAGRLRGSRGGERSRQGRGRGAGIQVRGQSWPGRRGPVRAHHAAAGDAGEAGGASAVQDLQGRALSSTWVLFRARVLLRLFFFSLLIPGALIGAHASSRRPAAAL